jgi:hypothetical protein
LLNEFGRAASATELSTQWTKNDDSKVSGQVFGLVKLPESLLVGADVRNAYMWNFADGKLADQRYLQMRADLTAQLKLGKLRAYGSLGYNRAESANLSQRAWVTKSSSSGNLVSREHWLGVDVTDSWLVRAGRLNQPFGLRVAEHTAWVRSATLTDINQHQQHGVAVAYDGNKMRAELLGILGNYQVSPDAYRDRGYAGYLEWYATKGLGLGLSSKLTHAKTDLSYRTSALRQAHGAFVRAALTPDLALLGEADLLATSAPERWSGVGHASFLQADWEVLSGVHVLGTGESVNLGDDRGNAFGGWLSAAWFFFSHFDIRVDFISRTSPGSTATTQTLLLQAHAYL